MHECMEDAVRMLVGLVEGGARRRMDRGTVRARGRTGGVEEEEEEEGGGGRGELCVAVYTFRPSAEGYSGSARRDVSPPFVSSPGTTASPGTEMQFELATS